MRRLGSVVIALVLAAVLVPSPADAQRNRARRPSDNVQTRSAALYLKTARETNDPEESRKLTQDALEVALEGTRRDAGNPRTWYLAGVAYLRLGDYAGADSVFDRAQEIYPEYEEIPRDRENAWIQAYNAGVVAIQQNKLEDAVANLQKANLIYDRRPGAQLNLGSVHQRLGRHDDAITAYRAALAILRGPGRQGLEARDEAQWTEWEEVAVYNLAQLLAVNRHDDEAASAYREFLTREPDNIQAQVNLAVVLTRQDKGAEAAQVYEQLLARSGLAAEDYEAIGIGLFRADRHDVAAAAFRKALAVNPHQRDTHYNLAQALYLLATELEGQHRSATGAAKDELRTRLLAIYEELNTAAQKVREMDPFNENAVRLVAQSHRGRADVLADTRAVDQARAAALQALEQHRAMTFYVDDVTLTPGEGSVKVQALLRNQKATPGQPITLRVELLGTDGATVAAQDVTVTAPAASGETAVSLEIPVTAPIAGWKMSQAG